MLVGGWERWKGNEVVRWERQREVRWEGGRFLVLFKGGKHRVSPRFYIFVSDVNQDFSFLFLMLIKGIMGQSDVTQGNKGNRLKIFLRAHRDGKKLLRSSASC